MLGKLSDVFDIIALESSSHWFVVKDLLASPSQEAAVAVSSLVSRFFLQDPPLDISLFDPKVHLRIAQTPSWTEDQLYEASLWIEARPGKPRPPKPSYMVEQLTGLEDDQQSAEASEGKGDDLAKYLKAVATGISRHTQGPIKVSEIVLGLCEHDCYPQLVDALLESMEGGKMDEQQRVLGFFKQWALVAHSELKSNAVLKDKAIAGILKLAARAGREVQLGAEDVVAVLRSQRATMKTSLAGSTAEPDTVEVKSATILCYGITFSALVLALTFSCLLVFSPEAKVLAEQITLASMFVFTKLRPSHILEAAADSDAPVSPVVEQLGKHQKALVRWCQDELEWAIRQGNTSAVLARLLELLNELLALRNLHAMVPLFDHLEELLYQDQSILTSWGELPLSVRFSVFPFS